MALEHFASDDQPAHWHMSTVGDEFDVQLGKMLDAGSNVGEPKPYVGNKAVQWGRVDVEDLPMVPLAKDELSRFRLRKGDLLVCEGGEVGRAAIWEGQIEECYYQKALHRLRPTRGFNPRLMLALLEHWALSGKYSEYVTKTSIAHLPREKFIEMPLPIPPAAEQTAIASVLDDVDALAGKLSTAIDKKRDLKQAAMQQLLTGRTRLAGFQADWKTQAVAEMGDVLAGKALDVLGEGTPRPYLRTKNVLDGRIEIGDVLHMPMTASEFERFRVEKGDVLLNEGQALELVGRCSLYRGELNRPCAMQNQLLRFRAGKDTSAEFAEQLFRHCQKTGIFAAIATQTTSVAHLGSVRFATLRLRWPMDVAEQTAIATVLSDMDAEIAALQDKRAKTLAIKQGMMQQLLTGRIRLT